MARVVLAVDGNAIVHRSFHSQAATGFRAPDGRPRWAVRGLLSQLVAAVERVDPDAFSPEVRRFQTGALGSTRYTFGGGVLPCA